MAALNPTPVPVDGGVPDLSAVAVAAAALGDTAPCGPGRFLAVINGDAAPHTITIATPGTVDGLAIEDLAVAVAAGKTAVFPLPRRPFAAGTGRAAITYDAVTSVTVAVLELGAQ
ncbi:hypothetical protein HHL19_36395 [Streptomyces sp. R302]|uniref:hypothetical protein n=1 Tax=unclassified Streptomyces TaxID=2593676 RepID=UPI00145C5D2A|nr:MULTISPECIES: hypothetical protein [unclassified Streptomyces]NML55666.1 hypothetical protein [Streptomyces sp. R301]NML83992.1 hypothetical protein [Streptomyces sp. R302]